MLTQQDPGIAMPKIQTSDSNGGNQQPPYVLSIWDDLYQVMPEPLQEPPTDQNDGGSLHPAHQSPAPKPFSGGAAAYASQEQEQEVVLC